MTKSILATSTHETFSVNLTSPSASHDEVNPRTIDTLNITLRQMHVGVDGAMNHPDAI